MANNSVKGYSEMYESPEDIDLWTAGISERPLPGSMVGPTFACIIGKQFHNFRSVTMIVKRGKTSWYFFRRFGDRFWYEGSGWPSSFTIEQVSHWLCRYQRNWMQSPLKNAKYEFLMLFRLQLNEIRKVKLSSIFCDNSDDINNMQVTSFNFHIVTENVVWLINGLWSLSPC